MTKNQMDKLIYKAESYIGDIMGELSEAYYADQGGAGGMVEGRFELSDDEIRYCMGDALIQVVGFVSNIDVSEIAEYWFERDYGRSA